MLGFKSSPYVDKFNYRVWKSISSYISCDPTLHRAKS